MLKRYVEVRQDTPIRHQLDDAIDVRIWIDVVQTNPRAELAQRRRQIVEMRAALDIAPGLFGVFQIDAIRARVLGDDEDLLDAGTHQLFGFSQHRADGAADEIAAHRWNDAEATAVIAAFGYLQVGVMARR